MEISSALLHFLRNTEFSPAIAKIHLFYYCCIAGRIRTAVFYRLWRFDCLTSLREIFQKLLEPIPQWITRTEKELCQNNHILLPKGYISVRKQFGTLLELREDWCHYNVKYLLIVSILKKYDNINIQ